MTNLVNSKPPSRPARSDSSRSDWSNDPTRLSLKPNDDTLKYQKTAHRSKASQISGLQKISITLLAAIGVGALGTAILWILSPKSSVYDETADSDVADVPAPPSEEFPEIETDNSHNSSNAASDSSRAVTPPPMSGFSGAGELDVDDFESSPARRQAVDHLSNAITFSSSPELDRVVDEIVGLAASRELSTQSLSVHLIDVDSQAEASYQSHMFRYPASIPKLFWLVAVYALQANGEIPIQPVDFPGTGCRTNLCKMAQKSDNEAASRIVDLITNTTSKQYGSDYSTWVRNRYSINQFFESAGYRGLDVSQKNFPIPYLDMELPKGRDLQMRGNPNNPTRNRLNAQQAAHLMYEIATQRAVSARASQEMLTLLKQDLDPNVWGPEEYDAIQGFFGEGLVQYRDRLKFYSKVGWTQEGRMEVAFIYDTISERAYILAVFGEGLDYGNDWEIFTQISELVYSRLVLNP